MNEPVFDHERFDVDGFSIESVAFSYGVDAHVINPTDRDCVGDCDRVRVRVPRC